MAAVIHAFLQETCIVTRLLYFVEIEYRARRFRAPMGIVVSKDEASRCVSMQEGASRQEVKLKWGLSAFGNILALQVKLPSSSERARLSQFPSQAFINLSHTCSHDQGQRGDSVTAARAQGLGISASA